MNRAELVRTTAAASNQPQWLVELILANLLEAMADELANNKVVAIRGFGAFEHRTQRGGQPVSFGDNQFTMPDQHRVVFKPGAPLKRRLAND